MGTGAEILIECLKHASVDVVFAYPGAASMLIHQALIGSGIRVVLPRHEQGGAFEAVGYARKSGRPGVCIATSGPGATNLVTGIADAWMDSIPTVFITAQVNQRLIGKNAFQETDIIGMTRPVVKHSYLVLKAEELPEVMADAFALAVGGRPGPVVVDIPWDVLASQCMPIYPDAPNLKAMCLTDPVSDDVIDELRDILVASRRPCIFAGGGVIHSGASELLLKFAEGWRIPVATSLMGIGAFPESHSLSLKWLGMHGLYGANKTIDECDLLIGLGVRFSDRVTGNINSFAPKAKIVHIDIDDSEINKNKHADFHVVSDIKDVLSRLLKRRPYTRGRDAWLKQVAKWKDSHPFAVPTSRRKQLNGPQVIAELSRLSGGNATVVTGVGQNQMWAAQFYEIHRTRQFLTSGGLGAMGFGLPAAIGAQLAAPAEQVLLIDGDGSFQMNIQELATVYAEKIPLKMVILNNSMLGMVAQWEDMFFEGKRGNTDLRLKDSTENYPDFAKIASAYGIPACTVSDMDTLKDAISVMFNTPGPYLIDCRIVHDAHVIPMIPAGKNCAETVFK